MKNSVVVPNGWTTKWEKQGAAIRIWLATVGRRRMLARTVSLQAGELLQYAPLLVVQIQGPTITPGPSRNIILELPGRGEGVVILGAHYDTTPDSVGANNNVSGMGVLRALAERLARLPWSNQAVSVCPFASRFIVFGQMYAES